MAGLAGSTHRVTELIERRQEEEEAGDLAEVTCSLLDNMVTVCGQHWTRCHRVEEVEVMRAMFVESIVSKNKDATFNIESCESVRIYRSKTINII